MTERQHDKSRLWVALKVLYGLREVPRLFQEYLAEVLTRHGWIRYKTDPMVFRHTSRALISVFANDWL
eukprot:1809587-Heterocapsa_arctica.AAC.1